MGAWQKATGSSTDVLMALSEAPEPVPQTYATESGKTRGGVSEQRQTRYDRAAQDANVKLKGRGKGFGKFKGKGPSHKGKGPSKSQDKGSSKGQHGSQPSGSHKWWQPKYDNR